MKLRKQQKKQYGDNLNKLITTWIKINDINREEGREEKTMVQVAERILELGLGTEEEQEFLKKVIKSYDTDTILKDYYKNISEVE